jgi:hypothetical protein
MLATISRILGYQLDDTHRASSEHARRRSGGVVPRLDRVLAGAAVLERLHDMTAADRRHPDSHVSVGGQT